MGDLEISYEIMFEVKGMKKGIDSNRQDSFTSSEVHLLKQVFCGRIKVRVDNESLMSHRFSLILLSDD